jgi:hypothetical protein
MLHGKCRWIDAEFEKKLSIRFLIVRQIENIALLLNRKYLLLFTSEKKFKKYSIFFDRIGDRKVRIINRLNPHFYKDQSRLFIHRLMYF